MMMDGQDVQPHKCQHVLEKLMNNVEKHIKGGALDVRLPQQARAGSKRLPGASQRSPPSAWPQRRCVVLQCNHDGLKTH